MYLISPQHIRYASTSYLSQNASCMPQVLHKNHLHLPLDCSPVSPLGYSASHQVDPVERVVEDGSCLSVHLFLDAL